MPALTHLVTSGSLVRASDPEPSLDATVIVTKRAVGPAPDSRCGATVACWQWTDVFVHYSAIKQKKNRVSLSYY